MSDVINVEIVVDVASLMASVSNPSTDPNNPTWVGHNFAYMIAANQYVKSGQASGDLSISVDTGDTIRWRMVSQSGNTGYSANLMNITHLSGDTITSDKEGQLAAPHTPVPGTAPGTVPLPVPASGTNAFQATKQFDFYVRADILDDGTENYSVLFVVLKYHGGSLNVEGYFAWDPTIKAS